MLLSRRQPLRGHSSLALASQCQALAFLRCPRPRRYSMPLVVPRCVGPVVNLFDSFSFSPCYLSANQPARAESLGDWHYRQRASSSLGYNSSICLLAPSSVTSVAHTAPNRRTDSVGATAAALMQHHRLRAGRFSKYTSSTVLSPVGLTTTHIALTCLWGWACPLEMPLTTLDLEGNKRLFDFSLSASVPLNFGTLLHPGGAGRDLVTYSGCCMQAREEW